MLSQESPLAALYPNLHRKCGVTARYFLPSSPLVPLCTHLLIQSVLPAIFSSIRFLFALNDYLKFFFLSFFSFLLLSFSYHSLFSFIFPIFCFSLHYINNLLSIFFVSFLFPFLSFVFCLLNHFFSVSFSFQYIFLFLYSFSF